MNKRIVHLVFSMFIATFVVVFISYSYAVKNRKKPIGILRYFPEVPTRFHLPANTNEQTLFASTSSCETGRPCTYPDVVDFRVIVITFNRANSLSKLLRSLDTLVLDGHRAALEIWIDRDRKNGVDQRTFEVASAFNWKGGATRVHVQVWPCTVCT